MSTHKNLLIELNNAGISVVFHICKDIKELASIEWKTQFSDPTDATFADYWDEYFTYYPEV